MRSQLTRTLFFVVIFTLVLATAILAELPVSSLPTPLDTTHSPYLTRFSERDPWISRHDRFSRAFVKQRRRFESFCRWVWDVVVPEVRPFRYVSPISLLSISLTCFIREDIFHLRLLEDTTFLSTRDVEQFSTRSELQRREVEDSDEDDDDESVTIFSLSFFCLNNLP